MYKDMAGRQPKKHPKNMKDKFEDMQKFLMGKFQKPDHWLSDLKKIQ